MTPACLRHGEGWVRGSTGTRSTNLRALRSGGGPVANGGARPAINRRARPFRHPAECQPGSAGRARRGLGSCAGERSGQSLPAQPHCSGAAPRHPFRRAQKARSRSRPGKPEYPHYSAARGTRLRLRDTKPTASRKMDMARSTSASAATMGGTRRTTLRFPCVPRSWKIRPLSRQ